MSLNVPKEQLGAVKMGMGDTQRPQRAVSVPRECKVFGSLYP